MESGRESASSRRGAEGSSEPGKPTSWPRPPGPAPCLHRHSGAPGTHVHTAGWRPAGVCPGEQPAQWPCGPGRRALHVALPPRGWRPSAVFPPELMMPWHLGFGVLRPTPNRTCPQASWRAAIVPSPVYPVTRPPASAAAGHVLGQGSHFWLRESVGPPARPAGRSPLVSRSLGTFSLVTGLHLLLPRPLGALLGNVPGQSQIGVQRPRPDTRVALALPGNPDSPGPRLRCPGRMWSTRKALGRGAVPAVASPSPARASFSPFPT